MSRRDFRAAASRRVVALCAIAGLWLATALTAGATGCTGKDLLADMSAAEKARLVAGTPYPTGNLWRATRGGDVITLVGTYHLGDPRFAPIVRRLAPILKSSDALMVEAGPVEQAKLKQEVTRDPGHMFIIKGPTLPERLADNEWKALSEAMTARGIPPVMAAKFQPWYVSMLLSMPPCAMDSLRDAQHGSGGGLDKRLMRMAEVDGVPIRALEPWNSALKIFDGLSQGDQAGIIRAALAMDDQTGDMFVTTVNAYFRGEHQLIWAFSRAKAEQETGADGDVLRREFKQMERLMLTDRNLEWIPVLERQAAGHHILAAFGAAHLGGEHGILYLLRQRGWTITRLD